MFLIKKAVFKPIDCKDSANRTQYQKKSKDFLLALLLDSSCWTLHANALRAPAKKMVFFLGIFVKIYVNLRKL